MYRIALPLLSALILLGVLAFLLYPRLINSPSHEPRVLWQLEGDSGCDLHRQACRVNLDQGQWVELSLEPRPVRVLTPFTIQVSVAGMELDKVQVDLNGVDMNMGYNRPLLEPVAEGRYEATGLLPMCVLERMTWRAQVLLDTPQGRGVAVFYFDTTRRGE
jgi:hypothetical protein